MDGNANPLRNFHVCLRYIYTLGALLHWEPTVPSLILNYIEWVVVVVVQTVFWSEKQKVRHNFRNGTWYILISFIQKNLTNKYSPIFWHFKYTVFITWNDAAIYHRKYSVNTLFRNKQVIIKKCRVLVYSNGKTQKLGLISYMQTLETATQSYLNSGVGI